MGQEKFSYELRWSYRLNSGLGLDKLYTAWTGATDWNQDWDWDIAGARSAKVTDELGMIHG